MRGTWILILAGVALAALTIGGATWWTSRQPVARDDWTVEAAGTGARPQEPATSEAVADVAAPVAPATARARPARAEREPASGADDLPEGVHWVEGVVRFPPATPLDEELRVVARGRDFEERDEMHSAAVDGDGRFRVAFAPETKRGRLELEARYLYLDEGLAVDVREPGTIVLEPELGGRFEGTLLLPPGEDVAPPGLEGKSISLWGSEQTSSNSWRSVVSKRAELSDDLTFEFGGLPPLARYHLNIDPGPYQGIDQSGFQIEPGRSLRADCQLEPGATLAGVVLDEEGAPVDHAQVEVRFENRFDWAAPRTTTTDDEGRFELTGLAPRDATIVATARDAPAVELELGQLEPETVRRDIELVLAGGGNLAGTVTWPDGSAVSKGWIEVELEPEEGETFGWNEGESRRTRIVDGRFELEGLTPGSWSPHAWAQEEAPGADDESLSLRERLKLRRESRDRPERHARLEGVPTGATGLEIRLETGHRLSGRVIDDRGAPLDSFRIRLIPFDEVRSPLERDDDAIAQRFRDTGGAFEFEGLPPGSYQLEAEAGEHAPFESQVVVPARSETTLVLPRAGFVAGRLLDSHGVPIEAAHVTAVKTGKEAWRSWEAVSEAVETDADGRFELDDVQPGSIRVRAFAAGQATTESEALRLDPGARIEGVTLTAGRAALLTGRVLGADGQPSADRSVSLEDERTRDHRWTETDGDGRFAFRDLPEGRYVLQVNPSSDDLAAARTDDDEQDWSVWQRLTIQRAVQLDEGETLDLVLRPDDELELSVEGIVRAAGEPVPGLTLMLRPREQGLWSKVQHAQTDADGRFRATLRSQGPWVATVTGPKTAGLTHTFPFELPTSGPLVFELPVGTITGRVLSPDGHAVPGIPVRITMAGPGTQLDGHSAVIADAEGRYALEHLTPGVYALSAGAPMPWLDTDRPEHAFDRGSVSGIELASGERLEGIDIVVVEPGTIAGVVRSAEGLPVAGALVHLFDESGRAIDVHLDTSADANGRFEVTRAPVGDVWLRASSETLTTPEARRVRVRSGAIARTDLTLEAGTTIVVETLRGGEPVSAALEALGADGLDFARFGSRSVGTGVQILGPLPPGSYTLTARTADGTEASQVVSTAGQLELTIALDLR